MGVLASDNFDRANVNPLGAPWSTGFGELAMQIVGSVATPSSTGTSDCSSDYTGIAWPANQYSKAKLSCVGTAGLGSGVCLKVRSAPGANTYYRLACDHAATNNITLDKNVATVFTTLTGWPQTLAWADGDTWELRVTGNRLQVFRNGVQVGADTIDSSIASGNPGIGYSSVETSASIDDWEGGGVFAAVAAVFPAAALLFPGRPFAPGNPLVEVKYYSPPATTGGINTPIGLDVASTFDPAFAMQSGYQRALDIAANCAVALSRQLAVLRALAVGSTFSPAIARGVAFLRSLGASSTFAPAIQRGFGRTMSVLSTFTASLTAGRSYARSVAASSTFNPALIRALGYQRALAIASSFTVTLTRAAAHPRTLSVTSAFSVSIQRTIGKTLAVSSAFTAAMARTTVYKRSLAITSTFAPVLGLTAAHAIALVVAATFTAAMTVGRGFFRTVGVASVFTPTLTKLATHAYFQTLAVASTFTATIARRAAYLRTLGANSAGTIALTRVAARSRALVATSPMVVALRRGISLRLGVNSIFSASIVRGLSRLLAVVAPFLVALAKGAKGLFDGFLTHIQSAFQVRAVGGPAQQTESKPHAAYEIRRSG